MTVVSSCEPVLNVYETAVANVCDNTLNPLVRKVDGQPFVSIDTCIDAWYSIDACIYTWYSIDACIYTWYSTVACFRTDFGRVSASCCCWRFRALWSQARCGICTGTRSRIRHPISKSKFGFFSPLRFDIPIDFEIEISFKWKFEMKTNWRFKNWLICPKFENRFRLCAVRLIMRLYRYIGKLCMYAFGLCEKCWNFGRMLARIWKFLNKIFKFARIWKC
jgi:hypothetical protein